MSLLIKPYIQTTNDSKDWGAKANLIFNPFTAITRGKIYMPDAVRDWGRATFGVGGNSDDKTALLWHSGILLSTGAASVALLRMLQAAADARVLLKANPEDKYKKLTSTTRLALVQAPELGQTKSASAVQLERALLKNVAAWVPAAALIVGGLFGYNVADGIADANYNRSLKKRIKLTDANINDTIIARAQLARGNTDGLEYKRALLRSKTASDGNTSYSEIWSDAKNMISGIGDWLAGLPEAAVDTYRSTEAALALLTAGVFALGTAGGYAWSAKRNKARQQHNAAKKAINLYIRNKVQELTIDTAPISADVVARIEGNTKPLTARQQPLLPAGLAGAPVSVDI